MENNLSKSISICFNTQMKSIPLYLISHRSFLILPIATDLLNKFDAEKP